MSGDRLDFGTGSFSFAAWISPQRPKKPFDWDAGSAFTGKNTDHDWQGIFGNELVVDGDDDNIFEGVEVNHPTLYVGDEGHLLIRFGDSADPSNFCEYQSVSPILSYPVDPDGYDNQYLVVTYDGFGKFSFYVDGELVDSSTVNDCIGLTPASQGDLYVGTASQVGYLYLDRFATDGGGQALVDIYYDGEAIWKWADENTNDLNLGLLITDNDSHELQVAECTTFDRFSFSGLGSNVFRQSILPVSDAIDLHWSLSNDYFQGALGDFRAYNYDLDAGQVGELYKSASYNLKLNFNEPPGETIFSDSSGNGLEATCSGDTCPDSGIPGLSNQVARFDGDAASLTNAVPDYLTLTTADKLGLTDDTFTVLAWVKLDDLGGDNTILGTDTAWGGAYFTESGRHLTVRDGKPIFGCTMEGVVNERTVTGDTTLVTDTWTHLAWVYDLAEQRIYVNGELDVTGEEVFCHGATQEDDTIWVGRWGDEAYRDIAPTYLDGMLDDLIIVGAALDEDDIEAIMLQAPVLNLHLDEDRVISSSSPAQSNGPARVNSAVAIEKDVIVTPTDVNVTEGGVTATYQVSLTKESWAWVNISVITDGQTTVSPTVLQFAPNTLGPQTITVTAMDDDLSEGFHYSTIDHTTGGGDPTYSSITPSSVKVRITDNEPFDYFADDGPYGNHATCLGDHCPQGGSNSNGKMREAPVFDGDDYLVAPVNSDQLDNFSISMWVKPAYIKNQEQVLVGSEPNFLIIRPNSLQLEFIPVLNSSTASLIEDQWNHVAVTFDGDTLTLYLNGSYDSVSPSGVSVNLSDEIIIGNGFEGNIDEVAVYGVVLSAGEVRDLYDYQAAWFDVTRQHQILVDAEPPVVELGVETDYVQADPDVVLAISAYDDHSAVALVEYSTDDAAWHAATQDNQAWIFTFAPAGEGPQTIYLRATDLAGNVGTAQTTLSVDNTAPNVSLDREFQNLKPPISLGLDRQIQAQSGQNSRI